MKLSAKGSVDPDGVKFETPSYTWQILTSDGGSIIKDGKSKVLSYEGFSISIDVAQNLESDQSYQAKLTYRIGTRVATAEFNFDVKAGAPPQLSLTQFTTAQNPSKKIRMLASVTSASTLKAKPEWLVADGQVEGEQKGGKKNSLFVIAENTIDEESTYTVEVSVENVDAKATSKMTFLTNSKPIAGTLIFLIVHVSCYLNKETTTVFAFNTLVVTAKDSSKKLQPQIILGRSYKGENLRKFFSYRWQQMVKISRKLKDLH